jgi:hypothetical protein
MVKRQTWILLALFLALAGFAIYQKYNPAAEKTDKNATPSATFAPVEFLFPADEGDVTSLSIENSTGEIVRLELQNKVWMLSEPLEAKADPASVGAAVAQVSALTVISHLKLDAAAAGLTSPAHTVTVGYDNGKSFTVQIGDEIPTNTGYYARKEDGSILVINKEGMDALLNLLVSPPFLETPTPSPIPPTETRTPQPASETPTVTKTP